MKLYFMAAGALLLGTSALAWQTDVSSTDDKSVAAAKLAALDAKIDAAAAQKPAFAVRTEEGGTKVAAVSSDTSGDKLAVADSTTATVPVGGPYEEIAAASVDLTPRLAEGNYPPCDPGPGDDRCIQLYEPGVRAQLASWDRPTGGLADGSATTAMGGPYEPVDADTTVASHSTHPAVGGPAASESGYPPCDPGPGDDRCIQLYEPGVTGAGN